jgi:hypothetical protein
MRLVVLFLVVALSGAVAREAPKSKLTPTPESITPIQLIESIRLDVAHQKSKLNNAYSILEVSQGEVDHLNAALNEADNQIQQVAKEREGWKDYGTQQHDLWMQDEIELAKYRKHGIFGTIASVAGMALSFVSNPFGFLVGKAISLAVGLVAVFVIFLIVRFLWRRYKKHRVTPDAVVQPK